MSYEGKMLLQFRMPTRSAVEQTLLRVLFKSGGVIKEFGAGEQIVDQVADEFELTKLQRSMEGLRAMNYLARLARRTCE